MAATVQWLGFAVSGAVLMQLLPGLVVQSQVTGAAWMWSPLPTCKLAAGSNWAFSAAVNSGTSDSIACTNAGASLPAGASTVACPSAIGLSSPDNGWWTGCRPGKSACGFQPEIGSGLSCTDAPTAVAATTTVAATTVAAAATTTAAAARATTVAATSAAAGATTAAASTGSTNAATTVAGTNASRATTKTTTPKATKAAAYGFASIGSGNQTGTASIASAAAAPGFLVAAAALAHLA
ncbi:unnamed protein product [Polarella glacialis]|uniref:Cellulase n=1 Tax=Polarella glacialis TaxID=89957 RepID=A0A813IA33_POLGL|nr:unnamed protein product [Polarella glacialis]